MRKEDADQKMKYVEWLLEYMDIRRKLWDEFPDRMTESAKKSAEMMLSRGLIKCKHEQ